MNETIIEPHVRSLYRLLNHGSELSDCRCIDVNKPGSSPVSRKLLKGEDEFVAWAREFNGRGNCFVGRNPRNSDGTVSRITSYTLDLDPPHAPRTSVPRSVVDKAVMAGRLVLQKWPGGYLAESGNGSLVVYRLAVPAVQDLDRFRRWLASRGDQVQAALAAGGLGEIICDKTHDNERIIKIPGTLSVKGDPSHWRLARFIDLPSLPYRAASWSPPLATEVTAKKGNPAGWLTDALSGLAPGNRDNTFTRVVGRLWYDRWGVGDIKALLLPHAVRVGFEEAALDRVIQSVGRYSQPDKPGNETAHTQASSVDEFLQDHTETDWICEPIVARKSIGFVAGLPKTMKTWLLIDLAVECARGGGKWLGLFPVKGARVLFIDQERFKGETQRRFRGVLKSKAVDPASLKDSLFVHCGTTTRIDLEPSYQAFRMELSRLKPDVVIVDSFATFHTRDDNSRSDIQPVLERIKRLREDFGCSIIFIDHENKGVFSDNLDAKKGKQEEPSAMRMAGSVGKLAAAEFILTVRRFDTKTSVVYHTMTTLGKSVPSFYARVTDGEDGAYRVGGEA